MKNNKCGCGKSTPYGETTESTLLTRTKTHHYDLIPCRDYGKEWKGGAVAVIIGTVVLVLVVGLVVGVRSWAHAAGRATCHGWGEATGREVNFVDYHYFSWDCLVKLPDGRWVPQAKVVAIEGEGGRMRIDLGVADD